MGFKMTNKSKFLRCGTSKIKNKGRALFGGGGSLPAPNQLQLIEYLIAKEEYELVLKVILDHQSHTNYVPG